MERNKFVILNKCAYLRLIKINVSQAKIKETI